MATKKTTAKKTTKAKVPTKSQVTAPKKVAAKKTAAKKAPAPAAKKAAPAKKAPAKKTAAKSARTQFGPEQRYKMIEMAAYFLAEKQGFNGDPHAIWVQAEKDVDAQIAVLKA